MKQLAATGLPVAAIAVAVLNGIVIATLISHQTDRDSIEDWIGLLLPVIAVLIALVLSMLMLTSRRTSSTVKRGSLWGAFAGGFLFLLLQLAMITPRYSLIASDGTAFWAMVILPAFYIAPLFYTVGAIAGRAIGSVAKCKDTA